jgi:hypothetical protein
MSAIEFDTIIQGATIYDGEGQTHFALMLASQETKLLRLEI